MLTDSHWTIWINFKNFKNQIKFVICNDVINKDDIPNLSEI